MTQQLYLTYDGLTVDFQASGKTLLDGFYPTVATDLASDVSERFDIWIKGTSEANLQTQIRAIGKAFEYAREYKDEPNKVCWLYYAPSQAVTAWRARVTDGTVILDPNLDRNWRQKKARVGVALMRHPDWYGAEAQLPLTNRNGTNNTSGLTVYTVNDSQAGKDNFVDITGADIDGDLPAPVRIEVTNTFNNAARSETVYVSLNKRSAPRALAQFRAPSYPS